MKTLIFGSWCKPGKWYKTSWYKTGCTVFGDINKGDKKNKLTGQSGHFSLRRTFNHFLFLACRWNPYFTMKIFVLTSGRGYINVRKRLTEIKKLPYWHFCLLFVSELQASPNWKFSSLKSIQAFHFRLKKNILRNKVRGLYLNTWHHNKILSFLNKSNILIWVSQKNYAACISIWLFHYYKFSIVNINNRCSKTFSCLSFSTMCF